MSSKSPSKREVTTSADGSPTIWVPSLDEHYHSIHGALTESKHVFIENGLKRTISELKARPRLADGSDIRILEVGLGTALNARLSFDFAQQSDIQLHYDALEKFPLTEAESILLAQSGMTDELPFLTAPPEVPTKLDGGVFTLLEQDLITFDAPSNFYDLIYFDAFAPSAQPELWTLSVFEKMFQTISPGGSLVTYCAKGDVKRAMKAAGFFVQKLPGPPRKREMTRAQKPQWT